MVSGRSTIRRPLERSPIKEKNKDKFKFIAIQLLFIATLNFDKSDRCRHATAHVVCSQNTRKNTPSIEPAKKEAHRIIVVKADSAVSFPCCCLSIQQKSGASRMVQCFMARTVNYANASDGIKRANVIPVLPLYGTAFLLFHAR